MSDRTDRTSMATTNVVHGDIIEPGSIELMASDVFLKHGFTGGDIFEDIMLDAGFDVQVNRPILDDMFYSESLGHAVLSAIVSSHLAPLLPPDSLKFYCSVAHNPIRVDDTPEYRKLLDGVTFHVSPREVVETTEALLPSFYQPAIEIKF